jgi:hypothetical protein
MRQGWRKKKGRKSGSAQLLAWLLLFVSGIGLFYLGSEEWLRTVSGVHAAAGGGALLLYLAHLLKPKY